MAIKLPSEYATVANDALVPADRWFILHKVDSAPQRRPLTALCHTRVEMVPLGTMVAHGRGLCPACHGAVSGVTSGPKA